MTAGLLAAAVVLGALAGMDPKLAIVGGFGMAFVLIVLNSLAAGLALFAVVSFLDLLPIGGAAVTLPKAAGLLLVVAWLAVLATRRETANEFFSDHPFISYVLLLFLGWGAASLLWAESPADGYDNLYRYGLNILLFLVAYTAISNRRDAVLVVSAFLVGALVSAIFGIASPAPVESLDDVSRLGGAGVEANELAAMLVCAMALATAFAAGWRGAPVVRLLAVGLIGFCVLGVVLSFSRGGLVALTVALVAGVVLSGRWRPAALVLLLSVGIGVVGYLAFVASPEQQERVTNVEGGTGRSDIWSVGWRMVEANPLTGVGVGNFPVSSVHYLLEPGSLLRDEFIVDQPKVAHNIYLEVLAEMGIVGLVLFLVILVFSVRSAVVAARTFGRAGDERMELLARAVAVALLALLAADFFASEQFSKQLWLLLALGPTLLRISRTEQAIAEPEPEPEPARRPLEPSYG